MTKHVNAARPPAPAAKRPQRKSFWKKSRALFLPAGLALFAFGSGGGTAIAQERAIELVNPSESMANIRTGAAVTTPDGNTTCYATEDELVGSEPNGMKSYDDGFCAHRTPAGWITKWITQPAPRGEDNVGAVGGQVWYLSDDAERVVFSSDAGIFPDYRGGPPTAPQHYGTASAFMREGFLHGDVETRWLSPTPVAERETRPFFTGPLGTGPGDQRLPTGASADLRYGIFESTLPLVPEDTNGDVDVYRWAPDGIQLISHDAEGKPVTARVPWTGFSQMKAQPGSISADGSRVFFHESSATGSSLPGSLPDIRTVYMWEDGQVTLISERPEGVPAAHVSFEQATPDGDVIFLSSTQQLTDDEKMAGANAIYRYEIDSDEMTLVVGGPDVGDVEFLGASEDASTVVYHTTALPRELWVLRNGQHHKLGTGTAVETNTNYQSVMSERWDGRALRITADGEVVVFQSRGAYGGEAPQPIGQEKDQVYRWTEDDGVIRISARYGGGSPQGIANFGNASYLLPIGIFDARYDFFNATMVRPHVGRGMTEDGSKIYFDTDEALVGKDTNGVADVYEWEDGEVRLITPGNQEEGAIYHDSSADGSTVFFLTRSRLIPELDRHTARSLYAARVGGGFPLPEAVAPCSGDACQAPTQGRPPAERLGSGTFEGDGNVSETRKAGTASLRLLATRKARGSRASIRVRVSGAGRVTVNGRGVLGTARRARGAGVIAVPVRLGRAGRQALARTGSVNRRVTVRFKRSGGSSVARKATVQFRSATRSSVQSRSVRQTMNREGR